MAVIKPFKGVRYNNDKAGSLEDLVTPPYDVIDHHAQAAFLERNQYNIIRLDLPKNPGETVADDPARHRRAADRLSTWLAKGIIQRDIAPCLYPYEVSYRLPNRESKTRKGFICLVELSDFSQGIIKPHEETFSTVTKDRLALTRACRAQFSQVFSVFSDPSGRVTGLLDENRGAMVAEVGDGDGNLHRLWQLDDQQAINEIQRHLDRQSLYIADGHHRYVTALAYRNEIQAPDGPENMIMMYLCPMEDDGLSILPTHRLLRYPASFVLQTFLADLQRWFQVDEVRGGSRETLLQEMLSRMEEAQGDSKREAVGVFGFYYALEDRGFVLRCRKEAVQSMTERPPGLRQLDAVILNDLIFSDVLKLDQWRCEQENLVSYHSDLSVALDMSVKQSAFADQETPLLFLVNAATIKQVQTVSDAGLFMPHKSTYFYPKVMTGLVMNVFAEHGPG